MRMPAAPRRTTGEGGLSLIEVLVTVTILGVAFVIILGGMTISISGSDVHRKQATSQTVLRNLAEHLKATEYQEGCPANYSDALVVFTQAFTEPVLVPNPESDGYEAPAEPAFAVRIVEVDHGVYSQSAPDEVTATFSDCIAGDEDTGLQRLTIEVQSLARPGLPPERLDVVKRTP